MAAAFSTAAVVVAAAGLASCAAACRAAAREKQRAEHPASSAVAGFVEALQALDIDALMACFHPECSVVFPFGGVPRPEHGVAAVRRRFEQYFGAERRTGNARISVEPLEVSYAAAGPSAVLVTFRLAYPEPAKVGRRSMLWTREGGAWRLLHLHASVVETPSPLTPAPPAPAPHGGLEAVPWSETALVVVDVQQDFWAIASSHAPQFPDAVKRLIATCRSANCRIVHLRGEFADHQDTPMPFYRSGKRQLPCIRGTPGVEVLPCVRSPSPLPCTPAPLRILVVLL